MSQSGNRTRTKSGVGSSANGKRLKPSPVRKTKPTTKIIARTKPELRHKARSTSMETTEQTNHLSTATELPAGAESLDKVRDILFGVQMRDYDKRFSQLEERLMREAALLREDVRKRFDALENYIKNEIEAVSERLKTERDERNSNVKELTRELRDLTKSTEKKNETFDTHLTKTQRELRQQILDQSKSLTDDIQSKYAEMSAALTREAQSLRTDKTDRSALASLFNELAMRLADDPRSGGSNNKK